MRRFGRLGIGWELFGGEEVACRVLRQSVIFFSLLMRARRRASL